MRAAIDGRRAARDLARVYGFPPTGNDETTTWQGDGFEDAAGVAGKASLYLDGNTSAVPHNWHGRLPVPMAWFGLHVGEMVVVNGVGNAPCPLHPDRKRSLSLKPSGEWTCPACGKGDFVGFVMRRYRCTFAQAVSYLVEATAC